MMIPFSLLYYTKPEGPLLTVYDACSTDIVKSLHTYVYAVHKTSSLNVSQTKSLNITLLKYSVVLNAKNLFL